VNRATVPGLGGVVTSGARVAAQSVLREWGAGARHATDLMESLPTCRELKGSDRAFMQDLVLTVLRNLTLLDHWISMMTGGKSLDQGTLWLLRGGLTELLILNVAEHAAVNENVGLAGRASGLVNAVLRRSCRERGLLLAGAGLLEAETRYSHPAFLLERWRDQLGEAGAEQMAAWNQEPAPVFVRMNRLHPDALSGMAGVAGIEPVGGDFFRCDLLPRAALAAGWCYAQDPSTVVAPGLLEVSPGMRVLDACAAPGGKTAFIAQMMENEGELVACDLPGGRLRRLEDNLARLGVRCAEIRGVDWLGDRPPTFEEGTFDRILLDAPCSNSGVMRRRVDVRWRLSESEFGRMSDLQRALLSRCVPLLKVGGYLVYSTCSIDREENEAQVAWMEAAFPDLTCIKVEARVPPLDAVDGAFAAVFERRR
jgi:16S rRNA (cytosine967-C5)-methyltransferase